MKEVSSHLRLKHPSATVVVVSQPRQHTSRVATGAEYVLMGMGEKRAAQLSHPGAGSLDCPHSLPPLLYSPKSITVGRIPAGRSLVRLYHRLAIHMHGAHVFATAKEKKGGINKTMSTGMSKSERSLALSGRPRQTARITWMNGGKRGSRAKQTQHREKERLGGKKCVAERRCK